MQNLAYDLDTDEHETSAREFQTAPAGGAGVDSERCAACGEELFGPEAQAASWQSWGTFWEIMALSNVELVCGACGEYLQDFFRSDCV
jgi:hypothetical protein